MPSKCAAYNCSQKADKEHGISLHQFPQDPIRRREWCARVRRDDHGKLWVPTGRAWLCSSHFEDGCFDRTGQTTRLRDGAMPTIFNYPAHLQRCPEGGGDERLNRRQQRMEVESAPERMADAHEAAHKGEEVLEEHLYCLPEPRVLKRRLDEAADKAESLHKQARNTSDREKRLRETLKSTLTELRDKSMVTAELKAQLAVYSDIPVDLFSRAESSYTEEQRDFALSLYLHGPKAYSFLRESAKLPLPHPRSLRRWLEKVDATPGISSAMIDHLKTKAEKDPNTFRNCTLMLDGMAIKQHVSYNGSSGDMVGFVDLGNGHSDEVEANDVLVLMVVGTTGHWKAPVAFFLNHGLTSTTQSQLVLLALSRLHEAGLQVHALTMDGHTANYGMCAVLGCDIASGATSFTDPASEREVFVIFDACHMQKLLRNMLKAYDTISSEEGQIKWSYIQQLQDLQDVIGLRLGNKLTHRHTYFENCKMKVSVSVQTLSSSVATALDFLQQSGHPAFQDVTATVSFIKHVDRAFDVLNSRSKFGKGFSAPLSASNYSDVRSQVDDLCTFLLSLRMRDGTPISKSRRYMCVVGTVTTLRSVMALAPVLLEVQDYILTYKFSQDHLELFFNAVRRSGGWNNNPSAAQFMATFRHMLHRCGVSPSSTGNVTALDPTSILAVGHTSSQRSAAVTTDTECDVEMLDVLDEHDYRPGLSSLVGNVVCYVAGFVVRRALARVDCASCQEALVSRQEPQDHAELYHLLQLKNRGGLMTPSAGALKVVLTAEEELRRRSVRLDSAQRVVQRRVLESAVLGRIGSEDVLSLGRHSLDSQYGLDNHHTDLIRLLVAIYHRVRLHHQARLHTARLKKNSLRQKLTKTVLFRGH